MVPSLSSPSGRTGTRTPALEAELSYPQDDVAQATYPPNYSAGSISAGADSEEREQLLGDSVLRPVKVGRWDQRKGWISIFGFSLPTPLVYLFAIPPLILGLFVFTRHLYRFSPYSHLPHPLLSNGTHSFYPTTLLISLDGFRASYLTLHPDLLPNILSLANSTSGIRAESMQPVFPTLTFPNHWALMTGLHPESHGIIANSFWDPDFGTEGTEFKIDDHAISYMSQWWWGEPLWSVVERVGRKSGVIMWPGPPVTSAGISPSYMVPFKDIPPPPKLQQIFEWLDLPLTSRPELIAAYFPDIDQKGHLGGPDSAEVEGSLTDMDNMIGVLVEGLEKRNLTSIVNLVVVSDHGMASTHNERLIYLDDILGPDGVEAIEHKDGWPCVGLRFKAGTDTELYLSRLMKAADDTNSSFAVYTHETMPDRWHFQNGRRIAPIYLIPKIGWVVTDHHEHEVIHEGDYRPKGNHGYDNIEPEMQAIFIAHGPFVNTLKGQIQSDDYVSVDPPTIESFRNLEIFSLVTTLLGLEGVEPRHNGTIGFWDKYLHA